MLRIASVVKWGDVRLLEAYERGVGVGLGFDLGSWAWTMDLDKWVKGFKVFKDCNYGYAVSIKEDTAYLCLHFTKDHKGSRINTPYLEESIRRIQVMIASLVGPAGDPWDQRVRSQLIGKDLVSGLLVYELPLSSLRKKYRLSLKNDMPPRDKSVETEFPAIVFNDELSSEKTLSCEPTISSLNNNEIDFRISFDESDDEDYTVNFNKNSFSYKIISVNDLKTDSENDNEKVNMPLFPSPEPTVSCFDDLDFFKDFKNEFLAIVYNDALTSKSDLLTEPTLSPEHIDEFDLKDETSLSEYDEVEQNVLYFNDLFPFNIIYLDNLKPDKDNNDNEIDIIQSLGGDVINSDTQDLYTANMALLPWDQRHQYLRVQVFNFGGLTDLMAEGLSGRIVGIQKSLQLIAASCS
ncbi:hypothetical protein Tco_0090565 [Tanacetum coccineum]